MNEVNARFYVLLDLDTMQFLQDYQLGGINTLYVLKADQFNSKEEAEEAKSTLQNKDRITVKEVQVIVCNMP